MATELLERLVIDHFDELSIDYRVLANDAVMLALPCKAAAEGSVKVVITDRELKSSEVGAFDVMALIASFPESQRLSALDVCNEASLVSAGKFVLEDDGDVVCHLNWSVTDRAEPEDTRLMLSCFMEVVNKYYPVIRAARWGNAPVEDAAESRQEESAAMSDDELRALLESLGLEDDEDDSQRR